MTILRSRLADVSDIFEGKSLDFVARKDSMYSGDIRRSLQITKRSVEVCRDRHLAKKLPKGAPITRVIFSDVIEAFSELFNSKTVHVLQNLQRNESLVTLALLSELISQKKEKILLDDVLDRFNSMQAILSGARVQGHMFREMVKRLQAFGIVLMQIEHSKICENVHLQLNVYNDDVVSGLG